MELHQKQRGGPYRQTIFKSRPHFVPRETTGLVKFVDVIISGNISLSEALSVNTPTIMTGLAFLLPSSFKTQLR